MKKKVENKGEEKSEDSKVVAAEKKAGIRKVDWKVVLGVVMLVLVLGGVGVYCAVSGGGDGGFEVGNAEDSSGVNWDNYPTHKVELSGSLTIAEAGVYELSGKIADGGVTVNTNGPVKLILNGVEIRNSSGPAIEVAKAEEVVVYLADGSENVLSDGGSYATALDATATATLYSEAKLVFDGAGMLKVDGNSLHAVVAKDDIEVYQGSYELTADQDAMNGKDTIAFYGGDLTIVAGDDAIHADGVLQIEDATIDVTESTEGLEATEIVIESGDINIVASDDGINASNSDATVECALTVNGGNLRVAANGDGLDSNGSIYINGGVVLIDGTTSGMDGALDYDGELKITGGTLLGVDSGMMSQGISDSSTQLGVLATFTQNYAAGSELALAVDDEVVFEFTSQKSFRAVVFSSKELERGKTCVISVNGAQVAEMTLTDTVTTYGATNMRGGEFEKGAGGRMMDLGDMDGERPDFGEMGDDPEFMGRQKQLPF